MLLFYSTFATVWLLLAAVHFYCVRQTGMFRKLPYETIVLLLPVCMCVYSLLELASWLNYEMTGYTSAALHFLLLLITLILRITCYMLVLLLIKGYSSLRVSFAKMEWRTMLGLVMFGTMGDLISEASDPRDWRNYVLPMTFQVTMALYCTVICWQQHDAIRQHRRKLLVAKESSTPQTPFEGIDYALYRYQRLALLQRINFALSTLGAGVLIGGVTWLRWQLANLPRNLETTPSQLSSPPVMALPSTALVLLDQLQYLSLYVYLCACLLMDLLPPIA